MKKRLSAIVLLSAAVLAGCQGSPQTVTQFTGPASAPTGAVVQGAAPVVAPLAPVAVRAAPVAAPAADTCGAAQYQALVGGPSAAVFDLPIPGSSRHYGSEERTATDTPTRLNFVHSGTAVDAVINPASTVLRVFCG